MPFTFQNRPPVAVEPLTLGSGDIEAVQYPPMPAFPQPPMRPAPAPRQPTRAPAPSPSLAPVAMNAVRGRADSTVPPPPARGSAPEMIVRTRPSLKAGLGILLAGAILGSVLGITTAPKQAVAAFSPATEFVSASTLPSAAKDELPPAAKLDVAKVDDAPAAKDTDEAKPAAGKKKVAVVRSNAGRTTVASAGPKPEKPAKAAKEDDSDDGYRVASADSSASKSSAKKKPAPKDDEDDAPAPPPKKKPKASDDAASVLRAAMGATENTL